MPTQINSFGRYRLRGPDRFSCKKTAKSAGPLFPERRDRFSKNPQTVRYATDFGNREGAVFPDSAPGNCSVERFVQPGSRDWIRSASSLPCSAPTQIRRILIADRIYLICWGNSRAFLCQIPMNSRKPARCAREKKRSICSLAP